MESPRRSEFDLTVQAKNGDASANLELWERYKPVAISILKPIHGLSFEEKLSEAYMLFLHKLELFDPSKVLAVRDPDTFTFSYMLIGGLKNLKRTLSFRWMHYNSNVSFMPFEDDCNWGIDKKYPCLVCKNGNFYMVNDKAVAEAFNLSNPANTLVDKSAARELQKKEQTLYDQLTETQKRILELRKEGKTLEEIGKTLNYSCTSIKNYLRSAKQIAATIFGARPELRISAAARV